jgi:hypothetical protein
MCGGRNRRAQAIDKAQHAMGDQAFADALAHRVRLATLADKHQKGASVRAHINWARSQHRLK